MLKTSPRSPSYICLICTLPGDSYYSRQAFYNLHPGDGLYLELGRGAAEWDLLGTGDIKIVAVSHAVLAEDYRGGAVPGRAQLRCFISDIILGNNGPN